MICIRWDIITLTFKDAEKRVFADQLAALDDRVRVDLARMRHDYDAQETRESLVARDADILECLLQAKEYYDQGHEGARLFFGKAPAFFKDRQRQAVCGSGSVIGIAAPGGRRL